MVSNLPSDKLINLQTYCNAQFPGQPQKFIMLQRKLVFPYRYMQNIDTLRHILPDRQWFVTLNDTPISDEDWEFFNELKAEFGITVLAHLLILYNTVDTILLADVWAEYRSKTLEEFGLEPARYTGAPSLSYDAAFKLTKTKLQLLPTEELYTFFERGIRGGVSSVNVREAKANNPGVPGYDPSKLMSHISFWDANNLYGKAMSELLPVSHFTVEGHPERFSEEVIMSIDPLGTTGYALEVDVKIKDEFHNMLNDYPILPSKLEITPDIISPYSKNMRSRLGMKECFKGLKLAPNFYEKKRYIVALPNLQYYISKGAVVTHVHTVVSFKQQAWLKPYIDLLTDQRRNADNEAERFRVKTEACACYGKFIQNVRRYTNSLLITSEREHKFQTTKAEFQGFQTFSRHLALLELRPKQVVLDRPVYAGFAVLEASKLHMYRMFYDIIRIKWPNARLLLTDTDSFLIQTYTESFTEDLKDIEEHFDFSTLPPEHELYSEVNRLVPGKFKSEVGGREVAHLIALRSKMYSMVIIGGTRKSAAAGVAREVAERIQHEEYISAKRSITRSRADQVHMRSKKHDIYIININKTTLSAYDDKRYLLDDGTCTLAYGHHDISIFDEF